MMSYEDECAKWLVSRVLQNPKGDYEDNIIRTEIETIVITAAIAGGIQDMVGAKDTYDVAITAENIARKLLEKLSEDSRCRINCYQDVFVPLQYFAQREGYNFSGW